MWDSFSLKKKKIFLYWTIWCVRYGVDSCFLVDFSRILYDLYQAEGLPSVDDTNKTRWWLRRLGKELEIELRLTASMKTKVYKRTSLVITTVRRLRNGQQREAFLEKEWQIQLSSDDIKPQQEVTLEAKLEEERARSEKLEEDNRWHWKQKWQTCLTKFKKPKAMDLCHIEAGPGWSHRPSVLSDIAVPLRENVQTDAVTHWLGWRQRDILPQKFPCKTKQQERWKLSP